MIELCNLRNIKPTHPYDVRVDRSSPLGNPFKGGDRNSQCNCYAEYFISAAVIDTPIKRELKRLWQLHKEHGQLRLFCWCVPLRCHSMTIKEFLDKYI